MGPTTSPVCFIHLTRVQVNCHLVVYRFDVEQGDTQAGKAPAKCAARRVELKVEEVIGRGQIPKPYGVHALPDHISKVLKN